MRGQNKLTERFQAALSYATELHSIQVRKGSNVPYVSHLLSVTALVLEDGGNEDQAIAALLHDAIEDQARDGMTRKEIRERFGEQVLSIVEACTDADTIPKPLWRERKERYIAHIRDMPDEAFKVSLADKLHNARSILADLRRVGEEVWERFNAGKEDTLRYYSEPVRAFDERAPGYMAAELGRTFSEIKRLSP
jgi:(p)ppGpp synthase/HD superfamily hydrolase